MGLKILWTGATPWTNSGYGKPGRYLFPRLHEAGHRNALAAFYGYQGATTMTQVAGTPLRIFGMARERFFNDIIEFHARSFEADVVISLQDVWILKDWGTPRGFVWCPRFPIDTHPVSSEILNAIEGCHTPLALTQWGQQELFEHGWPQARYIPHGVDLEIYRPRDPHVCRQSQGLPDTFTVGMVAANSSYPSRKSFVEILQAWQRWIGGGGEGVLYIHTTLTPKREAGIDFPKLFETMNALGGPPLEWSTVDDPEEERHKRANVLFPCQHRMWCHAYDDEALAEIYNCFDVCMHPSMAEGFGIPIVEAQASGVPVITLGCTSMPELTFAGVCIPVEQWQWEPQGGWRGVAPVGALVDAIQAAWELHRDADAQQQMAVQARDGVREFDFNYLVEHTWIPFLAELEEELKGGATEG